MLTNHVYGYYGEPHTDKPSLFEDQTLHVEWTHSSLSRLNGSDLDSRVVIVNFQRPTTLVWKATVDASSMLLLSSH